MAIAGKWMGAYFNRPDFPMFGFDVWALASVAAPLLTAIWACVAVIRRSSSTVPHGPSMCMATLAAVALVIV